MSFRIDRRELLLGTAAAAFAGLGNAHAESITIRSTHFGGPYQVLNEIVGKPFEAATGNHVIYDAEISPSIFPKLQTQLASPPYDVVMFSRAFALRAQKAGLLQKVTPGDFPESKNTLSGAITPDGWGISMMMDTMDIMVDTNQVKEPITSWMDLARPELKGKVMLPSSTEASTCFNFIASFIHATGDVRQQSVVDEAFTRLKALKPNLRGFFNDGLQPNLLIERGDIAVAPQFQIRIAQTSRKLPNVKKASPKEGVAAVPYDLCIPLNVKNVAAAKEYINFTLTRPVQEALATSLLASPARSDVSIPAEVAPYINSDPKLIWFQDPDYAAQKEREWLDRYVREVQS
jgi:putative spermidine/putrescine transport system substrate-binding protein